MEDTPEIQEDLGTGGQFKNWLQDNIRIILAVLIVIAIAAGIYSYSKRGVFPEEQQLAQEESTSLIGEDDSAKDDDNVAVTVIGEEGENTEKKDQVDKKDEVIVPENKEEQEAVKEEEKPAEAIVASSEETEEAFQETAATGDSLTVLARRATRNYLEKNTDQGLTKEHKIFIEDYLQKQIKDRSLPTGRQVSFSKVMIKDAIEKAKTLQPNQLENLKKYSVRVGGL